MIYKKTKRISEELSVIGLGTWRFGGTWDNWDENEYIKIIHTAVDKGINMIDTAPLYGNGVSEEIVGKALKGKRDKVFLATKVGRVWDKTGKSSSYNLKKDSILWEMERNLKRLKTDYVDLVHLHWPDHSTPLEETAEALKILKESGKTKYVGLSNFSAKDSKKMMELVGIDSQQNLYNMLERNTIDYRNHKLEYRTEKEIFPIVRKYGQAFFPFIPLFQGLLAGRFLEEGRYYSKNDERYGNPKLTDNNIYPRYLEAVEKLNEIAKELNKPLVQLSLNWLRQKEEITSVIAGVSSVEQLNINLGCLDWEIDEETNRKIEEIIKPFENI
ncbi:aldo/keto reductase [Miniphocaeibacter halophilus]|uniref:Aldo/keto reductase n=1 Tax=Miniphocaeibacter halophilus TaxID=2931922 RepID=A0AC61MT80_9FIRM|nr:aldo/keto reductase [Miniphocaeibacter halophilus]QQK08817.1 aldo/keto reductase [Miniphocaeibacter halophilus]